MVGLSQALGAHLGKKVFTCIRQPSQGPTFGIKGGAAGGGYSQVVPMEDFNLHLTGDIHAVSAANNLLAAAIDARMLHERASPTTRSWPRPCCPDGDIRRRACASAWPRLGIKAKTLADLTTADKRRMFRLDIDPASITWQRVVDVNDRHAAQHSDRPGRRGEGQRAHHRLRHLRRQRSHGDPGADDRPRRTCASGWAASSSAPTPRAKPVTAEDLGVAGAMTVLMKDAIMPNLMQTLEGTPAFVHAGPFANIAHGNSSIVADQIALKLVGRMATSSPSPASARTSAWKSSWTSSAATSGLIPERGRDRGDGPRAEDARRRAEGRGRAAARQGLHRREPGAARKGRGQPGQAHRERAGCSACRWSSPSTRSSTTPRQRSSWCRRSRSKPAPRARSSARTGCTAARARSSWPRR